VQRFQYGRYGDDHSAQPNHDAAGLRFELHVLL
jgi:hypothetical protein